MAESGSPMSAAIAILLAMVGLIPEGSKEASVYSHLMSAQNKWELSPCGGGNVKNPP